MIRRLIRLILEEIVNQACNSKGMSISYKPHRISEKVSRRLNLKNSMIVREVVKHVFEELCKHLNCEKYSTSKGIVYEFKRERILHLNIREFEDRLLS